jgi:hypothetical protein
MKVTLLLNDDVVKEVQKVALQRNTTLTGLVHEYLKALAAGNATPGCTRGQLDALEQTFARFSFKMGKRTWTRADLYERS